MRWSIGNRQGGNFSQPSHLPLTWPRDCPRESCGRRRSSVNARQESLPGQIGELLDTVPSRCVKPFHTIQNLSKNPFGSTTLINLKSKRLRVFCVDFFQFYPQRGRQPLVSPLWGLGGRADFPDALGQPRRTEKFPGLCGLSSGFMRGRGLKFRRPQFRNHP
jgi:hypothetical protein